MSISIARVLASSFIVAASLWTVPGAASSPIHTVAGGGDASRAAPAGERKKVDGASAVRVHNCHQDKKEIRVWRVELPSGTPEKMGSLETDPANPCPDAAGPSVVVPLDDGKAYEIITTDGPHGDNDCSTDDPMTVNCQRLVIEVGKGHKDGPVVDVTSG